MPEHDAARQWARARNGELVYLSDCKVRVERPQLRRPAADEGGEVETPAYLRIGHLPQRAANTQLDTTSDIGGDATMQGNGRRESQGLGVCEAALAAWRSSKLDAYEGIIEARLAELARVQHSVPVTGRPVGRVPGWASPR